ncbi:MAG: hypothetical protein ACO1QB_10800 [Verrucomicrobiales bacterium]
MEIKEAVCLHIPDEFEFMQPELMDEIEAAMAMIFDISNGQG